MNSTEQLTPQNNASYVRGDQSAMLAETTVSKFFSQCVAKYGDQNAVVFTQQNIRWTWHQLSERVDDLASGLLAAGIEKGDRVGIWSPNRYEWLLTQFATARVGAILVNINPAYRTHELEHALKKVEVKMLICADQFKTSQYLSMLAELVPELATAVPGELQSTALPALKHVVRMGTEKSPGMQNFNQLEQLGEPHHRAMLEVIGQTFLSSDAINIQFTSGTTGSPKGATLSHKNIVNNARFTAQAMLLTQSDTLCIPVPLYHCFGMVLGVLACVSVGACMVFPNESFDPASTMAAVTRERCTALHGVPTMFIAMLQHPDFAANDFASLRTGIMAGAPCPIETMKEVIAKMNLREITIAYGMTETSPVSFQSATDDPIEMRVSTVGRIQPHLDVKIIDSTGETVALNVTGELCTKGYSVMKGYWNDQEQTEGSIVDGWMHTGDLATIDERGYCKIVGRIKDMLIRGGENIYPREIEEFLFTHPKIQEVQVFGVPDSKFGEEVATWIVLKAGEQASAEEIREYCKGKISHYKIPRYVRIVTTLPMTVTGKPQKFLMRAAMVEALGLERSN